MGDLQTCLALLATASPARITAAIAALEPAKPEIMINGDKFLFVAAVGYILSNIVKVHDGVITYIGGNPIYPGETSFAGGILKIGSFTIQLEPYGGHWEVVRMTLYDGAPTRYEWAWHRGSPTLRQKIEGRTTTNYVGGREYITYQLSPQVVFLPNAGDYGSYVVNLRGRKILFRMTGQLTGKNCVITGSEIIFMIDGEPYRCRVKNRLHWL